MPRYTSGFTKQEFETDVLEALKKISGNKDLKTIPEISADLSQLNAKLFKDISKIKADFSRVSTQSDALPDMMGLQEMPVPHFMHKENNPQGEKYRNATGKMQYVGCMTAGSENETPVYFIIYMDYHCKLRGYVPTKGNSFDTKTKAAKPADKQTPLAQCFDAKALKQDIQKRIEFFGNNDATLSFLPELKM